MQDDIGFLRILSVSSIYDFFQDLVGVKDSRKWMAKTFWRLKGGEKIVDVGCGPGAILDYLPADVVYRGFDTSDAYIETARRKYGNRGEFIVSTAGGLLAGDWQRLCNADLVMCNGVLHHLEDDEVIEVFELSRRILSSTGRLVCLEPTYLTHQSRLSKWMIGKDRGKNVREEGRWKDLAVSVFEGCSTSILTGLIRLPYTHIVIECSRADGEKESSLCPDPLRKT